LDFVGGPYVPRWSAPPPEWLPSSYGAVIGLVDGGDKQVPFDENYGGILMGGNAVFTRAVLEKVGPYSTWLGRTDKGLLSGEDEELYGRLLASGAKGMYLPQLVIYHHVSSERLTKKYYRSWCFWRGVSLGLLEKTRRQDCAYLFGVPRWHYRSAARGLVAGVAGFFTGAKRESFTTELALWDFLGLFYGRHFHRAPTSR
jgi:GT2 family glycosyltransferase